MKKRAFLKVVACFVAATMFVLVGGGFTFSDVNKCRFVLEDDAEIIFEGIDCEYTEQAIIATLNGEVLITPNNILCIFGHSISTGTARVIDHRWWAAAPRCRSTLFDVQYCTRSNCDWMVMTQRSQSRISCCA